MTKCDEVEFDLQQLIELADESGEPGDSNTYVSILWKFQQLKRLLEHAANRLETIRETDKTGLQLDDGIAQIRAALET